MSIHHMCESTKDLLKSVIPRFQQLYPPRPAVCSQRHFFCQGLSPLLRTPACMRFHRSSAWAAFVTSHTAKPWYSLLHNFQAYGDAPQALQPAPDHTGLPLPDQCRVCRPALPRHLYICRFKGSVWLKLCLSCPGQEGKGCHLKSHNRSCEEQ